MKALLADAKKGLFQRVGFKRFDRLGRNLRETLANCDLLDTVNVEQVSVEEEIDTSTPDGRMMRNMLATFAEFEREVIVDRIQSGIEQKARQGEIVGPLSPWIPEGRKWTGGP